MIKRGRLPTRSSALRGAPLTGFPRMLLVMGIGFPTKAARAITGGVPLVHFVVFVF